MRHPVRLLALWLVGAFALPALAAPPASPAHEDGLLALTKVARHFNGKMAAAMTADGGAPDLAPWALKVRSESAGRQFIEAVRGQGIRVLTLTKTTLWVHWYVGPKLRYSANFALLVDEDRVLIISLSTSEYAEDEELNDLPSIRADDETPAYEPFVTAGKALDRALRHDGWKALPVAQEADLAEWLLVTPRDPERVGEERRKVPARLKETALRLRALKPTRTAFEVGTTGILCRDEHGALVAGLCARFRQREEPRLILEIGRAVAPRKPDGE